MPRHPIPFALVLAAALPALSSCGGGAEPPADAHELCQQGEVDEGFRTMKAEAQDPAIGLQDETLGRCLAAAVIAADERGEWQELPDRLGAAEALAPAEKGPAATAAAIEARAALAHARSTDRLCCLHDGLAQYDELATTLADAPPEQVEIVERWYGRTRDERLREGQWLVELGGRMIYAPTVGAIVPAQPADAYRARLGQELVLHNVLLMAETKDEPRVASGAALPRDQGAATLGRDHRAMVVRRPGAADGTVVAARWSEAWDALVAELHPGKLHTCRGTVEEIDRGGSAAGVVVLQSCAREDARTDALFRQRRCTVCGTRDGREVCHDGYGRNDGQAFQAAGTAVCQELLLFDERIEDCPQKVQMSRWCEPNDELPEDDPATPADAAEAPSRSLD